MPKIPLSCSLHLSIVFDDLIVRRISFFFANISKLNNDIYIRTFD